MNYENENWRVCEDSRGISADSKEMGESGIDSPSKDSFGVQVLQRGEPSGASESGDSERTPYGYIYITENLINGKRYIGQHKSQVFDKYYKGSGSVLRSAFDKYGWENFKTEILEWCDSEDSLNDREVYWIEYHDAVKSGMFYNVADGGYGNPLAGKSDDELVDIRRRISKTVSKSITGTGNPMYGKHLSNESKELLSKALSGKNNPNYGKPRSDDTKRKISLANTGKVRSYETRMKLRNINQSW